MSNQNQEGRTRNTGRQINTLKGSNRKHPNVESETPWVESETALRQIGKNQVCIVIRVAGAAI
eukprot:13958193-Heterocapsa_arctica.AAC.1